MAKRRPKTRIIPKPMEGTRVVFAPPQGPAVKGKDGSGINVVCGHCGKPIVVDAANVHLHNVVLKCSSCGAFGEVQSLAS